MIATTPGSHGVTVDEQRKTRPEFFLVIQMLDWLSSKPRSYSETMHAWKTSCPRLSIWEDAVDLGLVRLEGAEGTRMAEVAVRLTSEGSALLASEAAVAGNAAAAPRSPAIPHGRENARDAGRQMSLEGRVVQAFRTIWAAADLTRAVEGGRAPRASDLDELGIGDAVRRGLSSRWD